MWHAIYTMHAKEMDVAGYLAKAGVDAICPVAKSMIRARIKGTSSYMIKEVIGPIFPHYIFANATPELYPLVREPPDFLGVMRIIRCGQEYSEMEDEVVDSLRELGETIVNKDLSHLKIGTHVALGTLEGLIATITRVTDILSMQEVSVRFKMLGKWKETAVPALSVEPA